MVSPKAVVGYLTPDGAIDDVTVDNWEAGPDDKVGYVEGD